MNLINCLFHLLGGSCRGWQDTGLWGSVRFKPELHEVFVRTVHKIVRVLALVHPAQAVLYHVRLDGLGSDGKVVMGDLGEEQVVGHVSVCKLRGRYRRLQGE